MVMKIGCEIKRNGRETVELAWYGSYRSNRTHTT
jgi:hypothetical protein